MSLSMPFLCFLICYFLYPVDDKISSPYFVHSVSCKMSVPDMTRYRKTIVLRKRKFFHILSSYCFLPSSKQAADASTLMMNTLRIESMEFSRPPIGLQTTNNSFRMQEEEERCKRTSRQRLKSIASCTRFTRRKIKLLNFPLTHLTCKNLLFLMSKCMTLTAKTEGSWDERSKNTQQRWEMEWKKSAEEEVRRRKSAKRCKSHFLFQSLFISSVCRLSLFLLSWKHFDLHPFSKQYDICVFRVLNTFASSQRAILQL